MRLDSHYTASHAASLAWCSLHPDSRSATAWPTGSIVQQPCQLGQLICKLMRQAHTMAPATTCTHAPCESQPPCVSDNTALHTQGAPQHHQAGGRAAEKQHNAQPYCIFSAQLVRQATSSTKPLQGSREHLSLAHGAGRLAPLLQQPGHTAVLVVQVPTGEACDQAAGLVGPQADAAHCCVGIIQALHTGVAAPWLQHALLEPSTLAEGPLLLRGQGPCCGSSIDGCAARPVAWHRR